MDRRTFLKYSLATSAVVWAGEQVPSWLGIDPDVKSLFSVDSAHAASPSDVFPQSVASGDPGPNSIILWTRIVPPPQTTSAQVAYEISTSTSFTNPILRAVVNTSSTRDWTVKTQVKNSLLRPDRIHYYRFIFNGVASRTGRFRLLPSPSANVDTVNFAYISCQDYTNGYYTALAYLAEEDNVDFVVHLGDYIYETVNDSSFQGGQVRPINLPSGRDRAENIADYRFLYKKYKSDQNLQRVHERFAFITIWDDHEFANDCYRTFDTDTSEPTNNNDPQRRQDATRAWAEYTPVGVPYNSSEGPLDEIRIYRSFKFGNLMELVMTDQRLYRTAHPCGESTTDRVATPGCENRTNPKRSMLGTTQRNWFLNKITNSQSTWKIWGNEVMVMQNKILNTYVGSLFPELPATGDVFLNLDQWDGWPKERELILKTVRDRNVKNFVTITGDIHTFFAGYQRVNFDDPTEAPVGTCFVCGSVTSANLEEIATLGVGGPQLPPNRGDLLTAAIKGSNPHIEYMNSSGHGYNIMRVTPQALTCIMKSVDTIKQPQANLFTLREFRVPRDRVLIQQKPPV